MVTKLANLYRSGQSRTIQDTLGHENYVDFCQAEQNWGFSAADVFLRLLDVPFQR